MEYYHPGYNSQHKGDSIEEIYGKEDCPITGYLVSKAFHKQYLSIWNQDPKKAREHYNQYGLKLFGDCGAFSFIDDPTPPVSVQEVIDFYNQIGVDQGASLDHIVPDYDPNYDYFFGGLSEPAHFRERLNITIQNGQEFLDKCRSQKVEFLPVGSLQGWSPKSYVECLKAYQKMGYKKVALGGVAKLSPPKVIEVLSSLRDHLGETDLHVFGITQEVVLRAVKIPQITSVDGMGPYYSSLYNHGDSYRLGGTWHQVFPIGYGSTPEEERLYKEVRSLMVEGSEEDLQNLNDLLGNNDRYRAKLLRSLRDRVWEGCGCKVCTDLGWEVLLYDSQTNYGRGFHNMWQVNKELQKVQREVLDNG